MCIAGSFFSVEKFYESVLSHIQIVLFGKETPIAGQIVIGFPRGLSIFSVTIRGLLFA